MHFTNYIITENAPSSVDPLGFLRPSSAITDGLFKPFTVLSNHPANHGFLCWVYQFLRSKGITPASSDFSKSFREVEILWGLINAQIDTPVLNITKYKVLLQRHEMNLPTARKYRPLFERLNYGVLGHYSSPSAFWGLLEPKRDRLSALGESLGTAWEFRQGIHFRDIATAWLNGSSLDELSNLEKVQLAFGVEAAPDPAEQLVWKQTIQTLYQKTPVIAPLWMNPVSTETLQLGNKAETYARMFPSIEGHYSETTSELTRRIRHCMLFEIVAGFAQFLFDWEYVRRLPQCKDTAPEAKDLKETITLQLKHYAKELIRIEAGQNTWKLANLLSETDQFEVQARIILDHHAAHQKSKGASSFIVNDEVVVQDRVDPKSTWDRMNWFTEELDDLANRIAFTYKRNWHFGRAYVWQQYAGGAV